jgi:hypothetical protein
MYDNGDFKSLVFYNDTSTYWNTTLSLADSDGSAEVYDLCNSDANCVGYWALDGDYLDSKGSNDGTPTGTNNATGISSGAVRFDGVNDYVTIPDAPAMSGDLAMSLWIKGEDFSADDKYFLSLGYNNQHSLMCYHRNGQQKLIEYAGGATAIHSDVTLEEGTWYHLVWSRDSGVYTIYVNGVAESSYESPKNVNPAANDWHIGWARPRNNFDAFFSGSIDEVLIYDDSLTASEVQDLYKAGLSQHANANITLQTRTADSYNTSDSGLVGLWALNGDATDETGNNDGSFQGGMGTDDDSGIVGEGGSFDGVLG